MNVRILFVLFASLTLSFISPTFSSASDVYVGRKVCQFDEHKDATVLAPVRISGYEDGYAEENGVFICDAGEDVSKRFAVNHLFELNQKSPQPIVATCQSRVENTESDVNSDSSYSLYLDVHYSDGTNLWGLCFNFASNNSEWTQGKVVFLPQKPIQTLNCYGLFRNRKGKAFFKDFELREFRLDSEVGFYNGTPILLKRPEVDGAEILLRDAGKDGDFLGASLEATQKGQGVDVEGVFVKSEIQRLPSGADETVLKLTNETGEDRALTLVYSLPLPKIDGATWFWNANPRGETEIDDASEYSESTSVSDVGSGAMSRYPLGVVSAKDAQGRVFATGLAIDPNYPAFYRIACNGATRELYVAFDVALTPEVKSTELRVLPLDWKLSADGSCVEPIDRAANAPNVPKGSTPFRAGFDAFRRAFPENFVVRAVEQGNWMAFAKTSEVKGWEDFGFQFKEGNNEVAWDDAHGLTTFRYTEPMTWWQRVARVEGVPRTIDAALASAKEAAKGDKPDVEAQTLLTSGGFNESGKRSGILLDTPWCDGVVWSINDAPGLVELAKAGKLRDEINEGIEPVAGFDIKWNDAIANSLYGEVLSTDKLPKTYQEFADAQKRPGLDGEYVDSSEGYVSLKLDYRRAHFPGMETPLTFSRQSKKPAILRELISFEYVKRIADDSHARGKLAMANSTPHGCFWLATQLDVLGTETNWNWDGVWSPLSDEELLYRRAICCGKPYCFLMNSNFDQFTRDATEKYMKRATAYGMFPSFFSADASTKHYFTNPDLYERDRELFKKYMPIVKRVAESGWEPETLVISNDPQIYVERFGALKGACVASNANRPTEAVYLTVFNDSQEERDYEIELTAPILRHIDQTKASIRELIEDVDAPFEKGVITGRIGAQNVRVFEILAK